jgi:hypothetical protein
MDHCFLLSTTLARPGGLVLAPSAILTTINWSKATSCLISGILYHSEVSMKSKTLIYDSPSEETCLVVWSIIAARHKTTADIDVAVLVLLIYMQTVRAVIYWFERLSW